MSRRRPRLSRHSSARSFRGSSDDGSVMSFGMKSYGGNALGRRDDDYDDDQSCFSWESMNDDDDDASVFTYKSRSRSAQPRPRRVAADKY